jgi:hypothetical protein
MLDTVLNKAGRSAGEAVGAGVEGVAGGYIDFMFSPWGILVLGETHRCGTRCSATAPNPLHRFVHVVKALISYKYSVNVFYG